MLVNDGTLSFRIEDWIKSDFARSLEDEDDFAKWELFEIISSDGAYEVVREGDNDIASINNIYAIDSDKPDYERLKIEIGKVLISLRNSAIAVKLEGCSVGEGRLIIQNRFDISIGEIKDSDSPNKYRALWYGRMFRTSKGSSYVTQRKRKA